MSFSREGGPRVTDHNGDITTMSILDKNST